MNFKSYTKEECVKAQKEGKDLYQLDTGSSGNDDILIAGVGEQWQSVLAECLDFYGMSELPKNWSFEKIDWDIEREGSKKDNFKKFRGDIKNSNTVKYGRFKEGDAVEYHESPRSSSICEVIKINGDEMTLKVKTWSFPQEHKMGEIIKTFIDSGNISLFPDPNRYSTLKDNFKNFTSETQCLPIVKAIKQMNLERKKQQTDKTINVIVSSLKTTNYTSIYEGCKLDDNEKFKRAYLTMREEITGMPDSDFSKWNFPEIIDFRSVEGQMVFSAADEEYKTLMQLNGGNWEEYFNSLAKHGVHVEYDLDDDEFIVNPTVNASLKKISLGPEIKHYKELYKFTPPEQVEWAKGKVKQYLDNIIKIEADVKVVNEEVKKAQVEYNKKIAEIKERTGVEKLKMELEETQQNLFTSLSEGSELEEAVTRYKDGFIRAFEVLKPVKSPSATQKLKWLIAYLEKHDAYDKKVQDAYKKFEKAHTVEQTRERIETFKIEDFYGSIKKGSIFSGIVDFFKGLVGKIKEFMGVMTEATKSVDTIEELATDVAAGE